ncbi:hypothetical protein [Streptomyces sp. t39]|uniref:hypothetical protein n=1 Tax=Streptomyces sp. t39 TaxID=1828156 RepID=UPI0016500807|nr:hypothetical protein [Streptomyces sp. t39]
MPLIALVAEQYVQWRFGFAAGLGLALLAVGIKADNPTCTGVGGLLLVAPAVGAG